MVLPFFLPLSLPFSLFYDQHFVIINCECLSPSFPAIAITKAQCSNCWLLTVLLSSDPTDPIHQIQQGTSTQHNCQSILDQHWHLLASLFLVRTMPAPCAVMAILSMGKRSYGMITKNVTLPRPYCLSTPAPIHTPGRLPWKVPIVVIVAVIIIMVESVLSCIQKSKIN